MYKSHFSADTAGLIGVRQNASTVAAIVTRALCVKIIVVHSHAFLVC
jgi:hypothetical protein